LRLVVSRDGSAMFHRDMDHDMRDLISALDPVRPINLVR
jgi:hypothetical protein